MRVRHVLVLLGLAAVVAIGLTSCSELGVVSIDERITQFQSDLNSSTRSTIYEDFHPTLTSDYAALKDPTTTIDTVLPTGTNYSLTITDQSSPSTGVLVTITAGPASLSTPRYLRLVMDMTGLSDYRIVSLELDDGTGAFTSGPQIQ
jgi:hypothetical protein